MIDCTFALNGKLTSIFKCAASSFPAFSGYGRHINQRGSACLLGAGPIPPGTYYIFDRQSGGVLGAFYDMFNDHSDWFALHAIDKKIDDETYCSKVKRGAFRLHPKGMRGISEGCIAIEKKTDFQRLRTILKGSPPIAVPGITLKAYGKVVVR